MKICAIDGSIEFQRGTIRRELDRESFLATELGRDARRELISEIWWHLHIKPEPGIAAKVLYKGDKLDRVFLLMEIPSDDSGEWTLELELLRKEVHDKWLRSELGKPPYQYPWGVVVSEVDYKGVASEIIVAYES
jgi:hypothetical protein